MWEFLGNVLEQYGLAVVVIFATYAGLGIAIRELWKRLHTERDDAGKIAKAHEEAIAKILRDEHEKRGTMRSEHEREIAQLRGQLLGDAARFAERLDQLQEKRNDELREVLRESLEHMGATRGSVEKITEAMSTLRDLLRR